MRRFVALGARLTGFRNGLFSVNAVHPQTMIPLELSKGDDLVQFLNNASKYGFTQSQALFQVQNLKTLVTTPKDLADVTAALVGDEGRKALNEMLGKDHITQILEQGGYRPGYK